jgi:N-acetylmuramoyl-L-alanine amidase
VDVIVTTHGDYSERHTWANGAAVDVYLALHINAATSPSADYGAFFYHPATSPGNGDRLAGLMSNGMMELARRGVIQADGRTRTRAPGYRARAILVVG